MSPFLFFGLPFFSWIGGSLVSFALILLLALGWRRFFPDRFGQVQSNLVRQPVLSFVRGFFLSGAVVATIVILVVSVVGIPFAFAIGTALSIATYLGLALVCSVVGAALPLESMHGNEKRQIIGGTLVAFLVVQVPFVGPLVAAALAMAGIGAFYRSSTNSPKTNGLHPHRDAGTRPFASR